MLDLSYLMNSQASDIQIFDQAVVPGSISWTEWNKPRGTSMAYIMCIGAGSGGGGGQTGGGVANCSSGGGGGTGAIIQLLTPIIFLPDTLFISVGAGGTGGAANTYGTAGGNSNVSIYPYSSMLSSNLQGLILSANGSSVGGGWSANAAGAAGTAAGQPNIVKCPLSGLGISNSWSGLSGGTGTANTATAGGNINLGTGGQFICGGAPGAGCTNLANAAGGIINAGAFGYQYAMVAGAAGTGTNPGGQGSNGFQEMKTLYLTGAGGGGSSYTLAGGNGGNGAYGCGGGGGGGGFTGGTGGNGGGGLVIIISW